VAAGVDVGVSATGADAEGGEVGPLAVVKGAFVGELGGSDVDGLGCGGPPGLDGAQHDEANG